MAYNTLKPYIIIVEDDRAVATVIQYNLAKEGYMLRIVEDGDALFKHLEERVPDLIMLDVMLPKQSGIEILCYVTYKPQYSRDTNIDMFREK